MTGVMMRLACAAIVAAGLTGCDTVLGGNGSRGRTCGDAAETLPLVWTNPSAYAVGADGIIRVCLEDVDTRFHDIHYYEVYDDGELVIGEHEEEDGCILVPIQTTEATDARIQVVVAVDQDRIGSCDTHYYEASAVVDVRVREPDAVRRFEPNRSRCDWAGPYPLLAGTRVGFEYELQAGGERLEYGSTQAPTLLDVGLMAQVNDWQQYDVPESPTEFTITSLLDDGFTRDVIVFEPAQIDGIAFDADPSIYKSGSTSMHPLATVGGVIACTQPRDEEVQLTIETPALCTFTSGEPLGATTVMEFDGGVFVKGLDSPGVCRIRADYGGASDTFSITLED